MKENSTGRLRAGTKVLHGDIPSVEKFVELGRNLGRWKSDSEAAVDKIGGKESEGKSRRCRKLKKGLTKDVKNKKAEHAKEMQSRDYSNQEVEPRKTVAKGPMVETRKWKRLRRLNIELLLCSLCGRTDETVRHLLAGLTVIVGTEHVWRH